VTHLHQATTSKLRIAERFVSIQGEGSLTGTPSTFIRVSGCNLRCTWCDTPYASWNPEGDTHTIDELVTWTLAQPPRHVVLTGGEPMLFDAIEPLAKQLAAATLHLTVETAGTIFRPQTAFPIHLLSLSPKLANSTPAKDDPRDPTGSWHERHERGRLNTNTLNALLDDHPDHQLKFVVTNPTDLPEIDALIANLNISAPDRVMLMPEGTTVPSPRDTAWIIDACTARGWRFCHRLHIELFGDTRNT